MTLFGKILTGALVLVLVGIGTFYVTKNRSSEDTANDVAIEEVTETSTSTPTSTSTVATSTKKVPFSQFITNDTGSYKCEVTQNVNNMETKGTVYIKSGMVKGEFTTNVAGRLITADMISRDGYTYSWSSMAPTTGYKVKITASTTTGSTSGAYSWNADKIGDYTCLAEDVSDETFAVPTNISFTTMNQQ